MAEAFVGQIGMFGFSFVPQDWAYCSGSELLVMQYQALYAVIGTTFGSTSNQKFNLPDLRGGYGLSGIGTGDAGYAGVYSEKVGSLQTVVSASNLPTHTHAVVAANAVANDPATLLPAGKVLAEGYYGSGPAGQRPRNIYTAYNQNTAVPMANTTISPFGGAGTAVVGNQQPYVALNLCICIDGYFPVRP
ncbi:phage tail protein [Magnetospirillum sulfuroxidans]|uniref:Tail fiber protein n=1 Tax=Magnetospirillum sulfuroxidans TaxID=611300 RepID=A0ABS5IA60_9PROT|nr:tail fiber protein [Magnetospirillum sulfuroxidans]MBR9971302.1 tail fiber protein [Magnetospirillum sulfuroxidans]